MKLYQSTSPTDQSSHRNYHKSTIATLVTIYFGRITKGLPKFYQSFTIGAKAQYDRTEGSTIVQKVGTIVLNIGTIVPKLCTLINTLPSCNTIVLILLPFTMVRLPNFYHCCTKVKPLGPGSVRLMDDCVGSTIVLSLAC